MGGSCVVRATGFPRPFRYAALALIASLFVMPALADAPKADWKADWDKTIEAASKEGQVVISGPSGRGWRDFLTQRFQKDFPKIQLKLTATAGRDFWPRLVKEREVGEYLWDMRVGGSDDNTHVLKTQGVFDTTRDKLVLPEVLDDNAWWGGLDALFVSLDHTTLIAFAMYEQGMANYNRKLLPNGVNLQDLTKPEWKGKISMADPRGGSSLNTMSVLMKAYGEDYVRTLLTTQNPIITKDPRQQIEWLASGRYPVAFGLPTAALVEYAARGGDIVDFKQTEGPRSWTQGVGGISLINKAPHPNASKVFINWVLTKPIQTELMQAVKLNSRRKDVPPGDPETTIDTSRLSEYVGSQHEEIDYFHKRTSALLREIGK
jgi:iron(III) transport system substrate-binding protein